MSEQIKRMSRNNVKYLRPPDASSSTELTLLTLPVLVRVAVIVIVIIIVVIVVIVVTDENKVNSTGVWQKENMDIIFQFET